MLAKERKYAPVCKMKLAVDLVRDLDQCQLSLASKIKGTSNELIARCSQ